MKKTFLGQFDLTIHPEQSQIGQCNNWTTFSRTTFPNTPCSCHHRCITLYQAAAERERERPFFNSHSVDGVLRSQMENVAALVALFEEFMPWKTCSPVDDGDGCSTSAKMTTVQLTGVDKCGTGWLRELPYMMSASEGGGGHGKGDVVREVA